jgi:V-type H+-transporting ATPase subunit a
MIVDTYGIPTYQEANPTPVSIVTFPFCFGMMFGDMGHGSILAFFALFLTLGNDKLQKSVFKDLLQIRYFLLMMGLCSFYCGLMYNEFFAMPVSVFTSCYDLKNKQEWLIYENNQVPQPSGNWYFKRTSFDDCTYPFGVDPVWGLSTGQLSFNNQIKMKLSVIMGIVHMTIGVIMKGTNNVFHGDYVALVFEVIGGLVLLLGLFGYMDLLIFSKWFSPIEYANNSVIAPPNPQKPNDVNVLLGDAASRLTPSVINVMITTVFSGGSPPATDPTQYAFLVSGDRSVYPPIQSQQDSMYSTAVTLLIMGVISVPLMLLVKPLCCRPKNIVHEHDEIEFAQIAQADNDSLAINDNRDGTDELIDNRKKQMKSIEETLKSLAGEGHDNSFGEVFVHQMIETIEFALATVSNTASYLRLWALSLAHGQLAEVFMTLTFKLVFSINNFFGTLITGIILWPAFWSVTFAVLMCMDCLECALHTLRLHWVEFQNKFFKGQGYEFKPYNFKIILIDVLGS